MLLVMRVLTSMPRNDNGQLFLSFFGNLFEVSFSILIEWVLCVHGSPHVLVFSKSTPWYVLENNVGRSSI
jgi:hypothetical protein